MQDLKGLFVFRRDLRTQDNSALNDLLDRCKEVHCIFILDPKQINPRNNKFFSAPAMRFMLDCLIELQEKIPLKVLDGDPYDIIKSLSSKYDLITFNRDWSKYANERDAKLIEIPRIHNPKEIDIPIVTSHFDDVGLNAPLRVPPYKVFTPYYNYVTKIKVRQPENKSTSKITAFPGKTVNLQKLRKNIEDMIKKQNMDLDLIQRGGRKAALVCIKKFQCSKYKANRDMLTAENSRLSPHLKFGTVSAREVYYACNSTEFRKQLYWRDFYLQIGYHFPKVYGNNFRNKIKWSNNLTHFKKWCAGETGYDIVDACMSQLNKSGYMHNRGRMIVASFLTKILHIDWRLGEQYFASRLTDYDPANNNGGWQWSAGTGCDAQPYYRIFNPYTQAAKFDPDGEYRKKWLTRKKEVAEIVDYDVERVAALKLIS